MNFSPIQLPETNNDVVIGCNLSGIICHIQNSAVPVLNKPYFYKSQTPILPLSDHMAEPGNNYLKNLPFTLLCDIFHDKVCHYEGPPALCPKCSAYLPLESFPSGTGLCPFCNNSEMPDSFVSFPNKIKEPQFLFLLIGNATDYFYNSIKSFPYPLLLMTYNDHFIMCQYKNERFSQIHLLDSEIPPNSFSKFPADKEIPHFSDSTMYKVDFNQIFNELKIALPNSESELPLNIVVFSNVPHTCLEETYDFIPNTTLTICSMNTFICNCNKICYKTGGLFLPHTQNFKIPYLTQIISTTVRHGNAIELEEDRSLSIVFPGIYLVNDKLPSESYSKVNPIQIVIEASKRTYCFSTTYYTQTGLKPFLYSASMPNMMISLEEANLNFSEILINYSKSLSDGLLIPNSLKYTLLFPKLSPRRTMHCILTNRPFVYQIEPVLHPIDFISESICTTISIILILYENTIYVYVGSEVKKDKWKDVIGASPMSHMISFEIVNVDESFQSDLWTLIRAIRAIYYPYIIPVIVVPNESGRRVQLMQILDIDYTNGSNNVYKMYGDIARKALLQK